MHGPQSLAFKKSTAVACSGLRASLARLWPNVLVTTSGFSLSSDTKALTRWRTVFCAPTLNSLGIAHATISSEAARVASLVGLRWLKGLAGAAGGLRRISAIVGYPSRNRG